MKLTAKIVGSIIVALALTSAASFWITQHRVNQQAEEAFRDKVRQITGMATATRDWFSENIDLMVPSKTFKSIKQVPEAAHGSSEITKNITGVASAAGRTSGGAENTQQAAQQLVETSAELRRLVEQFKIGAEASGSGEQAKRLAAHASM